MSTETNGKPPVAVTEAGFARGAVKQLWRIWEAQEAKLRGDAAGNAWGPANKATWMLYTRNASLGISNFK